jgi:DNA-directed RNA polymerase sigma subunit (sigma70/sigma32)
LISPLTATPSGATTGDVSVYWPTEDGWPYQDGRPEAADPNGELDDDLLSVRLPAAHLLDHLDPLEREVIAAHYGLSGPARSMKQLHADLGLPRAELRTVLGSGLAKLRAELSDPPLP